MKTSYFTFGFDHAHAVNGFTFDKDVVVKIVSENPRETMVKYFGEKWAFEYSEKPDMRYFPRGIKDLTQMECEHYYLPSGGNWSPINQQTCQFCGKTINN